MQSIKRAHFEELVDHIIEWIFEVNITARETIVSRSHDIA